MEWSNYGGPQLSRQNQKPHGKTKNLTVKPKTSRRKQSTSWQNQKPHGKTKDLTAQPNTSQQKPNTSWQKQILHGKSKYPQQNQSYFVFPVKYLVLQ